jgi:tetratricopeptide (TPR) repeat protein
MKLLLECHEELGELKQREAGTDNPALSVLRIEEAQLVVLCRLSRTLLQSGALKAGIGYCDMIVERLGMLSKYEQTEGGAPILARMTAQMNFARAVALFGISNFEEAMSLFESIIQAGGQDQEVGGAEGASLRASPSRSSNQEFPSLLEGLIHAEESLVSMSVNNYAVCALYVKRVRESIDTLERLVQRDPARFLIDPVVFNLCTLYDLSCSPELSVRKKKMLQRVAATFNIHEPLLNAKSFRLT